MSKEELTIAHFLTNNCVFFTLLQDGMHFVMQRVSLPLSLFSFMMQLVVFFQPKEDVCIFLHCSSCLDLWTIKHMAEPATDLAFAALLFPIRLLAIENLWNTPTSIPLLFSPSHPQTTRATGDSRCIVYGRRGGPEEKKSTTGKLRGMPDHLNSLGCDLLPLSIYNHSLLKMLRDEVWGRIKWHLWIRKKHTGKQRC